MVKCLGCGIQPSYASPFKKNGNCDACEEVRVIMSGIPDQPNTRTIFNGAFNSANGCIRERPRHRKRRSLSYCDHKSANR